MNLCFVELFAKNKWIRTTRWEVTSVHPDAQAIYHYRFNIDLHGVNTNKKIVHIIIVTHIDFRTMKNTKDC